MTSRVFDRDAYGLQEPTEYQSLFVGNLEYDITTPDFRFENGNISAAFVMPHPFDNSFDIVGANDCPVIDRYTWSVAHRSVSAGNAFAPNPMALEASIGLVHPRTLWDPSGDPLKSVHVLRPDGTKLFSKNNNTRPNTWTTSELVLDVTTNLTPTASDLTPIDGADSTSLGQGLVFNGSQRTVEVHKPWPFGKLAVAVWFKNDSSGVGIIGATDLPVTYGVIINCNIIWHYEKVRSMMFRNLQMDLGVYGPGQ